MDLHKLGTTPVEEDNPCGADARYETEFDELQAEVGRLAIASDNDSPINWPLISSLAAGILENQSKDLLVASYLGVAQIHLEQLAGLEIALQIFIDLFENFWDCLFPKKKRMRGRIAAVEWWVEKSAAAVDLLGLQSIEEGKKTALLTDCERLKQLFQELFPEPPVFGPLLRVLEDLPAVGEVQPDKPAAQAPAKKDEARVKRQDPVETRQQVQPPPAVQGDDPVKVIQSSSEYIKRASLDLVQSDPANPLGHRFLRLAVWSIIDDPPQATDGKTIIPPPEPHIIEALNDLADRGDWLNLSLSATTHFSQYIFWLDLQRYCASGLESLGPVYTKAHDTVCRETAGLLHRLPGLCVLQFSDGSPLADEETQEWCRSLESGGGPMDISADFSAGGGGTEEEQNIVAALQQAEELLKGNKLIEAVGLLQQGIAATPCDRESIQWRIGLVQILMRGKQAGLALSHCEKLTEDIDRFRLEQWDPVQALRIYKIFYHCLKAVSSKLLKERGSELLGKIARLDSAEAIRIVSG